MKKNDEMVAKKINALGLSGVEVVCDDGAVILNVKGDEARTREVAKAVADAGLDVETSDGVQGGMVWLNNDKLDLHDELCAFSS